MPQKQLNEDIVFSPVRDLAGRIRAGKLSPVELTEAYLARLDKIGTKLGAVATVTRERALEEARAAEKEARAGKFRGPLHGVPYGLKDLVATRGIPTTWGAAPYQKQVFDYDATIVRKLRDAGAVLVAKLAMVELAGAFGYHTADASITGPCRTPWNTDYWAGGSSSGSAAAVAAGLVPFTIGSETSGSIITPAAFCGVTGLRPTYGRVSRHGAMALSWTLDKLGPICRTADDCGLVLEAIAGRDARDPSTAQRAFTWAEDPKRANATPLNGKRWRIGAIRVKDLSMQPAVRKNYEASLQVLAKFADVQDTRMPELPIGPTMGLIIDSEAAASFRELLESGRCRELRDPGGRWGGYSGLAVPAVDYLLAMRARVSVKRQLDEWLAKLDAVVAPSRNTVAYPIGVDFRKAYPGVGGGPALIPAGNLAGQPAVSVPNGFNDGQLPTGLQFIGRAWSEPRLLTLAKLYQDATEWHTQRPKLG
jgi:aspartyl-tRNA(Asn)/glutamyl-tRNA(Gln) amidotransferase subunit A